MAASRWVAVGIAVVTATWCATALPAAAPAAGAPTGSILPYPEPPFLGKIGRIPEESEPMLPQAPHAPAGAPNVLLIMTDDVGFASAQTFGGPVPTPTLNDLAAHGLRYNRFQTTAMCSPTRAALLTGRNHQNVGNGTVEDMTTGYPGYNGEIPHSAATIAQILRGNGYNTAMFGKHHNVPYQQMSPAGPFDLWPTGLGFDYFFGFIGGDTDQWHPKLYRGITPIDVAGELKGELLDKALADEAIHWIHNQKAAAPDKPFFVYYAPGTAHAPHQAPADWIAKFKGQFDQGWDRLREESFARQKTAGLIPANADLTPRPAIIPAWDSLTPEQQRVDARMMEVFAAMLAYQDAQIGRVVDELRRMGQLNHTLVIFIEGDNGASGEGGPDGSANELGGMVNGMQQPTAWLTSVIDQFGGPKSYELYPVGWAWALDTPYQWTKQIASHLGGTRNGLVISWPEGIKAQGGVRSQFHHVIDIAPTILDAAGVSAPRSVNGVAQKPFDGISMRYSFDDAAAPDRRTTQYFEMLGNRGIYHNGWLASTTPLRGTWIQNAKPVPIDSYNWELYDLRSDFTQAHDVAATEPAKLKALQDLWWQEARRNQVLPVDNRIGYARAFDSRKPRGAAPSSFVYWGADISIAQLSAPQFVARSFSISADTVLPAEASGVLVADGSWFGGWSFFLDKGHVVAHAAVSQKAEDQYEVVSTEVLPAGATQIQIDFDYDGGGPGRGGLLRISADGHEIGRGRIERTILITAGLGETFDIGLDTGVPVTDRYRGDGRFNGEIRKVEVSLH